MIQALGFSENRFDPKDPGRLCRGRERWIEPWETDDRAPELHRIVVSGAMFSDDGAADARRGIPFSGVDIPAVLEVLYPETRWIAFMEDGHPADIPVDAIGVEAYEGYRAGGRQELGLVRWTLPLRDLDQLRELIGEEAAEDRIRGLVAVADDFDLSDGDGASLMQRVFELVGFSTLDSPPARYQPSALPELLELASAVVLLHRDKHGPALAIYAGAPIDDLPGKLSELQASTLLVPFAIPPMLARWDRALAELRSHWSQSHDEPFPVPAAPPPPMSEGRRHRRWSRDDEEIDRALDETPVQEDDAGEE